MVLLVQAIRENSQAIQLTDGQTVPGGFLSLIALDMDAYAEKCGQKVLQQAAH